MVESHSMVTVLLVKALSVWVEHYISSPPVKFYFTMAHMLTLLTTLAGNHTVVLVV